MARVVTCWLDGVDGSGHSLAHLPLGVGALAAGPAPVTRIGDHVIALDAVAGTGLLPPAPWWRQPTLNGLLAAGPAAWQEVRDGLVEAFTDPQHRAGLTPALLPVAEVAMLRPVDVGDYVDFYASEQHAANLGRILRPGQPPLLPNWRHLPVGYHGRSGTIVVSGTPVRRPCGQRRGAGEQPVFGPTERLDVEVEVGFVVGAGSTLGEPIATAAFDRHVFGVCLINDWSARDIQAWEAQPLGPFLGKSFATSMSPWLVPLAALQAARLPAASADAPLLPYLREEGPWGLDITLELTVDGVLVSRPPYRDMFWSPAQMLAHLTVNGASVRPGDLYASGTVSGASPDEVGSLIEAGEPVHFLADGSEVVISASAPATDGGRLDLGRVTGTVLPAHAA